MVQRAWLSHVRHLGSFLPPLPPSSGKTQNPSSLVSKVGLSGCNICARACARMSSVRTVWSACWTTPASCFFFTCSHTHAHGSSLIIKQPTHTVDWFGSQGDVAGELDLIEFLLQVSIDPLFNISMDLAGYSAAVDTLLSGKSVVQYRDFNGASAAQSISANKCGLKDLWRLS